MSKAKELNQKSLQELFKRVTYFKATFRKVRAKGKIFKKEVEYFIVGVLPIELETAGKIKTVSLNIPVKTYLHPCMKNLQGVKFEDKKLQRHYKKESEEIIDKLIENYKKVLRDQTIGKEVFEKARLKQYK